MPTLTPGDKLSGETRRAILAAFPFRWTVENRSRAAAALGGPLSIAPISDAEWLRTHAFRINRDGSLSRRARYAEPAYLAQ